MTAAVAVVGGRVTRALTLLTGSTLRLTAVTSSLYNHTKHYPQLAHSKCKLT